MLDSEFRTSADEQEKRIFQALRDGEQSRRGRGFVVTVNLTPDDAEYLASWYETFAAAISAPGTERDARSYYKEREAKKAAQTLRGVVPPVPTIKEEKPPTPESTEKPRIEKVDPTTERVQTPLGTGYVLSRHRETQYGEFMGLRYFLRGPYVSVVLDTHKGIMDFEPEEVRNDGVPNEK